MQIKADEISKIIREQIEGYERQTDLAEVGTILSVGDGIGRIYGLEKVMAGELLELPQHGGPQIAVQLSHFLILCHCPDDNTKVFRLDGLNKAKETLAFFAAGNFFGYTHGIGKGDQYQVPSSQR